MKYALLAIALLACATAPQIAPEPNAIYPGPRVQPDAPIVPEVKSSPRMKALALDVESIETYRHGRLYAMFDGHPDASFYPAARGGVLLAIELPPDVGLVAIDYYQEGGLWRTSWSGNAVDGYALLRLLRRCEAGAEYGSVGKVTAYLRIGDRVDTGTVLFAGTPSGVLPCQGAAIPVSERRRAVEP